MTGGFSPPSTLAAVLAAGNNANGLGITNLASLGFRDTSAAFDVTLGFTSTAALSAARSITWDVNNTSQILKFTAASTVTFPAGTNTLATLGTNTFTGVQLITLGSAGAPGIAFVGDATTGIYGDGSGHISIAGTASELVRFHGDYTWIKSPLFVGAAGSVAINNASGNILTIGGGGSVTELRVFGDAAKYLSLTHDGTNGVLSASSGVLTLGSNPKVVSGQTFTLGNAAVTGLGAGVVAALTNATLVVLDNSGQAYRIPCII